MKQKNCYNIHFVCRGNTFRSRLAAAKFHQIASERYLANSSGVMIDAQLPATVEAYTADVAKKNGLNHQISTRKVQSSQGQFDSADLLIFLHKDIYDYAVRHYKIDSRKSIVWNISDIESQPALMGSYRLTTLSKQKIAHRIYEKINKKVVDLYSYISAGSWVDVITKDNQYTGIRLPIQLVTDRGYWHRGVHAIVMTHKQEIVVEKRSQSILFSPGMLDVSLGGCVDAGERPIRAILRECQEEIGINVAPEHVYFLSARRVYSYRAITKKKNNHVLYSYAVILPDDKYDFVPQEEEVAAIVTVDKKTIYRLLRKRYLPGLGRLNYAQKIYKDSVREAYALHRKLKTGK